MLPRMKRLEEEARHLRWFQRWARDPFYSEIRRQVREGMSGTTPRRRLRRSGSVHVVAIVRDEVDVIDGLIEHHLSQGADRIIVADNMSMDGTREKLADWAREDSRVTVLDDRLHAFHQDVKTAYLARVAWDAGADWVVPVDADERWVGEDAPLRDFLWRVEAEIIEARIHNVYPVQHAPVGHPRHTWRWDSAEHPTVHVAFRAHPFAVPSNGNHTVRRPGTHDSGLHLVHIPWRSPEQLARKVARGAASLGAAALGDGVDGHWFTMASIDPATMGAIWAEIAGGPVTDIDFGYKPIGPFSYIDTTSPRTWNDFLQRALPPSA